MGKYNKSPLHEWYSDWHYKGLIATDKKYESLRMTDIDRMWVEIDSCSNVILGIFDLKVMNSPFDHGERSTSKLVYDYFSNLNIPIYLVYIDYLQPEKYRKVQVVNYKTKRKIDFENEIKYADWLMELRKNCWRNQEMVYNLYLDKDKSEDSKIIKELLGKISILESKLDTILHNTESNVEISMKFPQDPENVVYIKGMRKEVN